MQLLLSNSTCITIAIRQLLCQVLRSTLHPPRGRSRNSRTPRVHTSLHFTSLNFTSLHTLHSLLSTLHPSHFPLYISHHAPRTTVHTPHFTLSTPHSTLDTPPLTPHARHPTLHSLHSTLRSLHSTLHTLRSAPELGNFTIHTLHALSVPCAPHFTLHTSHSPLHTPHFALEGEEWCQNAVPLRWYTKNFFAQSKMILSRAWLHDTVSCAAWNDARKEVY